VGLLVDGEVVGGVGAAELRGGAWWAAAMLLGANGQRCGELIVCIVEDLGNHA